MCDDGDKDKVIKRLVPGWFALNLLSNELISMKKLTQSRLLENSIVVPVLLRG